MLVFGQINPHHKLSEYSRHALKGKAADGSKLSTKQLKEGLGEYLAVRTVHVHVRCVGASTAAISSHMMCTCTCTVLSSDVVRSAYSSNCVLLRHANCSIVTKVCADVTVLCVCLCAAVGAERREAVTQRDRLRLLQSQPRAPEAAVRQSPQGRPRQQQVQPHWPLQKVRAYGAML